MATGRPCDVSEELVTREGEPADREASCSRASFGAPASNELLSVIVMMVSSCTKRCSRNGAHERQISAHRSTVSGPMIVCSRITPGRSLVNRYALCGGQQCHVAAARSDASHLLPDRFAADRDRPGLAVGANRCCRASRDRRGPCRPSRVQTRRVTRCATRTSPSARSTSSTYCMFLPTATFS